MRIIAGRLGGRTFAAPKGHRTHPMSDKVRGALFAVLGDVAGLTLLDAFAGSGAISLEAASRGAKDIVAIDNDKQAARTIRENIEVLELQKDLTLVQTNAVSWSNAHQNSQFDLVVLDPPYDKVLYTSLIKLGRHVKPGGLLVLSLPGDEDNFKMPGFTQVAQKSYGDAQLIFYKNML